MRQDVINRLVKDIPKVNAAPFWAKEMKFTKDLYAQYEDIGFWKQLKIPYKIQSLAYFKSEDGQKELKKQWAIYKYEPPIVQERIELGEKVGKKYKSTKTHKTLLEFIDG